MLPGLIASVLVVVLMQLQSWIPVERMVHNQVVRWRGASGWDSRIVMVNIDDATLEAFGQFPISRDYLAQLLNRLREENASVVVLNLILSDERPSSSLQVQMEEIAGENSTSKMAEEMIQHGRVVIGQTWEPSGSMIAPLSPLSEAAIATGHTRLPVDLDGFTRFVELTYNNLPALGVAAIQAYSLEDELVSIPTEVNQIRLNWPGAVDSLTALSLVDVLNNNFTDSLFKGKIVIVGYTATSSPSPMRTPFDNRWSVSGGYMHAAVIDNLLNQSWLRTASQSTVIFFLLLVGPLLSWLLYRRQSWVQVGITGACAVVWLVACVSAMHAGIVLPVVSPLVIIVGTGTILFVWGRLQSNALLQVRSAFLSMMSHEIRTPLNAIINLSEMLKDTALDERQQEYVDTLRSSSQTLMALINDVLDFSKIESGQLTFEDYPVSLIETIERSVELLAPRAAEKGIDIAYAVDSDVPAMVVSDPVRLQQILINLLSNAVKFTESGEVSVRVSARPMRARQTSEDGYELLFEVRDTGIGIPAERMARLFEPFSQVSASTTRKYGGTGLGLSISKRLSERMGGELWVRSVVGQGSTFYFTLQTKAANVKEALPNDMRLLSGAHILLVDTNKTRCEQVVRELQRLNISSIEAVSIAEAVVAIRSASTPDGVSLSGVILESAILESAITQRFDEVDGAIGALRDAANNSRLPIILLSSLNQALSTISDDVTVLRKPVKRSALHQALRSINPSTKPLTLTTAQKRSHFSSTNVAPTTGRQQQTLKILVAEDNRINQKVALRLLELLGYQADVVSSGRAVLGALDHRYYDIILMDMKMPDMDGVETTRQIRQRQRQANVWIIAMTANAMTKDRKRCFAAGMNDYLRKPIKREALDQALKRAILDLQTRQLPG